MNDLEKVFNAARAINGHNKREAGKAMGDDGYSLTTINRFFDGTLEYTDNVEAAVRQYIYDAGLVKSIQDLGLDPNQPANSKLETTNQ